MTTLLIDPTTIGEAVIIDAYFQSAQEAYKLAKAEHASNLRAERSEYPAWEAGPVHAYSRAVGSLEALRDLLMVIDPVLWGDEQLHIDRFSLREAARQDAVEEYDRQRYEDWALRMRVERRAA